MTTRILAMTIGGMLVVAGCETEAFALTCMRPSPDLAWCDDGTMAWDASPQMRTVDGPGAERGLQSYPIPSGGLADAPQAPSRESAPVIQLVPHSLNGGCVRLNGRTVCW